MDSTHHGECARTIGERPFRVNVDRPACVLACPVRRNGLDMPGDEAVDFADKRLKRDPVGLSRCGVVSPRLHHSCLVALQRLTARLGALPSSLELSHGALECSQATDMADSEDAGIGGLIRGGHGKG